MRKYYQPGRFVPFLGFEWASNIYGHRNVIYPVDREELIYPRSFRNEADSPDALYTLLADRKAIIIPHHTSWPVNNGGRVGGTDWRYHNARLTCLVEIC